MLWIITGIIISYLTGSIPTAYIFGRCIKGIDIRKFGSGNVGATNAMRVLGKPVGITVLIIDVIKGLLPVVVLTDFLGAKNPSLNSEVLMLIFGISCIAGHNWTVFLKFKGGKGVATTLGVLLGLSFKVSGLKLALGMSVLTWIVVFAVTRIVSIASLLASLSFPIYAAILKQSHLIILLSVILCLFVFLRHRQNIIRIFKGQEKRL